MSHSSEPIICPNCGFPATRNYCAECGQETHLHKESFWGLVMHFIGHYFHYDSKFWKTLKALWFSPGMLTTAYINKQRMRYIPPISLYIFISAVYFLLKFSVHQESIPVSHAAKNTKQPLVITNNRDTIKAGDINFTASEDSSAIGRFLHERSKRIEEKHGDVNKYLLENINHTFPKIFFFMIPIMALFLKVLFFRRKDLYFVDHAIFALHYHCFWFSLLLPNIIKISNAVNFIYVSIFSVIVFIYMIRAMKNVYHIRTGRAIFSTITIAIGYGIFFVIALLLDLLIITATA